MIIKNTPENIIKEIANDYPEIEQIIFDAHIRIPKYKGSMQPFQAASLYKLVKDHKPQTLLEIGTGVGYSTYFLACACAGFGEVISITPNLEEIKVAEESVGLRNVSYFARTSRDFWEMNETYFAGRKEYYFDFILVDGDHKDIAFDLNWYERLNSGGFIIFHDYSPNDSWSPQPKVHKALTKQIDVWGKPDFLVQDNDEVGMIGWTKR